MESARIIKEKGTRKSLGYGFVRFRTANEALHAIHGLNGTKIENKVLKVCAPTRPPTRPPARLDACARARVSVKRAG